MKRKKIKIRYIIFIIFVFTFIYNSRWVRAKRFFGINIMKYKVVRIDNTLSCFDYSGRYTIILEFKENRLDSFCETVEKKFGKGMTKNEMEKDYDTGTAMFAENIFGMKLEADDIIYNWTGGKKRVILNPFLSIPKSAGVCIVYKPVANGKYRAWLSYVD